MHGTNLLVNCYWLWGHCHGSKRALLANVVLYRAMTNSKDKKNKTKTATIITAFVLGLVMLSPTTVMPSVNAQQDSQLSVATIHGKSMPNSETQAQFNILQNELPQPLSKTDLVKVENIALSDQKVQEMIGGKPVELMSQGFWGNVKTNPGVWYPQINLNVGNKTQLVVLVDEQNKTVLKSFVGIPIGIKFAVTNATSSDTYDNPSPPSNADGILINTQAPSFTSSSSYNDTGFMVNAAETGSSGNLCNSGNSGGYWMQTGFDFGTAHPVQTFWTDTFKGCQAQSTSVSYVASHQYTFWILPQSGSSNWAAVIQDTTSGSSNTYTDTGMSQYTFDTNAADDSKGWLSVWFENDNTRTASPNWDGQFGSNPSAKSQLELGSTWGSWGSGNDNQRDFNCNGLILDSPSNGGPGVISGNLQSSSSSTSWNLSTMASSVPAC